MGWGDAFSSAWQTASDAAKSAASAAASTAQSAYQYGKAKAVATAEYVADKAGQAYNYARDSARDAQRSVVDSAYDGLAGGAESARQGYNKTSQTARRAYDKARSALGLKPAGKPVQPCPLAKVADSTVSNASIDGWMMAPQGPGKDCVAVPPGSKALASARKRAVMSDSACCKAKRGGEPPRDIIYVNGITTDAKKHCETLNQIAAQTCGRVVGVYNATEGFALDAAQTGQDRRLIKSAAAGKPLPGRDGRNPAVDTLSRSVADEVESGAKPEIWAHSQGGAVTSLALMEAKNDLAVTTGNPDPLAGVKVKSFGSAAPQWTDGPSYEHYVHMNDPVPTMLGLGHSPASDTALAGKGAKVVRFAGDVNGSGPFEVADPKKEWLPLNLDNHAVTESYIKMEKQQNGGCP